MWGYPMALGANRIAIYSGAARARIHWATGIFYSQICFF